jgi:hypothetical protein
MVQLLLLIGPIHNIRLQFLNLILNLLQAALQVLQVLIRDLFSSPPLSACDNVHSYQVFNADSLRNVAIRFDITLEHLKLRSERVDTSHTIRGHERGAGFVVKARNIFPACHDLVMVR